MKQFHQVKSQSQISPRTLSLLILVFGFSLFLALFRPVSLVFSGDWKLNQKIDLAKQVVINFDRFGLGFLNGVFGVEEGAGGLPIGTISIRFYTLLMVVAILSGYFLVSRLSKLHYIASTVIDRILLGFVIVGIVGARIFFVIFHWSEFQQNPQDILLELSSGGMAFFGMLIAGLIYLWLYCSRFKFNFWEFADFLVPGVLLGQIIGRFGNFFNYESYGQETSVFWKMFIPETANYYTDINAKFFHPTFLYEIIPNFFLLFFLLFFYERLTTKRSGLVFAFYCIGYGLIRFWVEFFRLDALVINLPGFLQFPITPFLNSPSVILVSQFAALCLFIFGIWVFFSRNKILYLKKSMEEYEIR